jgi:hypothetical protein
MPSEPLPADTLTQRAGWAGALSPRQIAATLRDLVDAVRADRWLKMFLALMLLGDLALIAAHVGYRLTVRETLNLDFLRDYAFYMKYSRSYAAFYGFAMMGGVVLVAAWVFAAVREPVYAGIGIVFLGVLANAVFGLHVIMGDWVDDTFGLQTIYFRAGSYIGEAISFALIGILLFILLLVTSFRSSPAHGSVGTLTAMTLIALATFDGLLDLLHALHIYSAQWLDATMVVVEEGGELASITAALFIVAAAAAGRHRLSQRVTVE